MIGTTLSHYRILEELGRGGMGIVYKAQDTKLDRTVAIKVLPAAALASEDDRSRFYREARAAAGLTHPNIAAVYEIDEAIPVDTDGNEIGATDGPRPFIVLEFIDGETLSERIKGGPLKLTEAVAIAGQVTDALKMAHANEVVHRDIKSANVMLTGDGVAKVLDFGLAKTNQSTMLTRMGSTLGTVNYMSPEQARGQDVDGRTDLYSLGTMLYEMIAGRLPFSGEYEQAVLYSILNENPEPLTALRTGVPMQLEWIVNKLLSKEAEYRYQTAADLLADLKTVDLSGSGHSRRSMTAMSAASTSGAVSSPASAGAMGDTGLQEAAATGTKSFSIQTWGLLAVAVIVSLAAGWILKPTPTTIRPPVRRLTVQLPDFNFVGFPTGSKDGKYWAFSAIDSTATPKTHLWNVHDNTLATIPGSDGKWVPRFSPDGSWISMMSGGGTRRAQIPSGSALDVSPEPESVWLDNDHVIVMDRDSLRLWRLSIGTGEREAIDMERADSAYVRFSQLHRIEETSLLLVTASYDGDQRDVLLLDADDGSVTTLIRGACCTRPFGKSTILYLTGTDLELSEGRLVAQRFDAGSKQVSGAPVALYAENIRDHQFGVGADDSFFKFADQQINGVDKGLSWLDPSTGNATSIGFPRARYDRLSFSPDGTHIAMERIQADGANPGINIYLFNLETGTEQRLTYTVPVNRAPVWTTSGKIYFAGGPVGSSNIYVKNADGSGPETKLVDGGDFPTVSPDEKWLVYVRQEHLGDLWALNLETGQEVAVDTSSFRSNDPAISPDGRFIAYSLDTTDDNVVTQEQRVYVRSFPDTDRFYIQAIGGRADDPLWSRDGRHLYFRSNGQIKRIGVTTKNGFRPVSSPENVASFPGVTVRMATNPIDERLLIVHLGSASQDVTSNIAEIILSFSAYLDELLGEID